MSITSIIQNFNYVMDVLLPEAVIKLLMDKSDLEYEEVHNSYQHYYIAYLLKLYTG